MAGGSSPIGQNVLGFWNESRLLRWITRRKPGWSHSPNNAHPPSVSRFSLSNRNHPKQTLYTRLIKGWLSTSSVTRQVHLEYTTEPPSSERRYYHQPKGSVSANFIGDHSGISFNTVSSPSTPGETSGYDAADCIPDLSSVVSISNRHPVFKGTYSSVYKGAFQGRAVCMHSLLLAHHLNNWLQGCREGSPFHREEVCHG